jgi:hypothetical protein
MAAMKRIYKVIVSALILAVVFSSTALSFVPVTGVASLVSTSVQTGIPAAPAAAQVDLAGAFIYDVIQQPRGNAGFVSTERDKLTQFSLASKFGSQGFLAHNYLAGATFKYLVVGSQITVTYADGYRMTYEVQQVRHLQATHPTSPTTSFLDLDNNNTQLTAKQVFMQTYGIRDRLVLQTCIARDKELSWGRLFIIATPAE